MLVYKKSYPMKMKLDYIEAHGTGTPVGDDVEYNSISKFFTESAVPVGSIKSIFGHSKGAAGAAGLLKGLEIIRNRTIPGSKHYQNGQFPKDGKSGKPFINQDSITIGEKDTSIRIGINSFGFGGANFHLSLEEYKVNSGLAERKNQSKGDILVVCARSELDLSNFDTGTYLSSDLPFKIPPNSLKAIDKVQQAALVTVNRCIEQLGATFKQIPREKVNVVCASTISLEIVSELTHRLTYEAICSHLEHSSSEERLITSLRKVIEEKIKPKFAPINEDSSTGILNNVIAARICNLYDFKGKAYNIDRELASIPVGLEVVMEELQADPSQIFFFIGVEESYNQDELCVNRNKVSVSVLASKSFAIENELEVIGTLNHQRLNL